MKIDSAPAGKVPRREVILVRQSCTEMLDLPDRVRDELGRDGTSDGFLERASAREAVAIMSCSFCLWDSC